MPSVLGQVTREASALARLAGFFQPSADPWECLAIEVPPQVFGQASTRAFAHYLEGPTRVPVQDLEGLCHWLRGCEAIDDSTLFCEADFWQHPVTFEQVRKGDCEDHALWAWRQLVRLGHPALFVSGLWGRIPHAWVQVNHRGVDGVLETTAKCDRMFLPLADAQAHYCPALAVDAQLRTYVYQGYQRLHTVCRGAGPATLVKRRGMERPALTDRLTATLTPPPQPARDPSFEVAILAGGRSSRLGRDKARVRVRGRSLLARVRAAAHALQSARVRVIRQDLVPACGPLGGVITALASARSPVVLFLSCDLPLVTPALLQRVRQALGRRADAAFATVDDLPGFPFVIRTRALPALTAQLDRGERSLREVVRTLGARCVRIPTRERDQLFNVNTPEDLAELRRRLRKTPGIPA